jgi:hypothetical protein
MVEGIVQNFKNTFVSVLCEGDTAFCGAEMSKKKRSVSAEGEKRVFGDFVELGRGKNCFK